MHNFDKVLKAANLTPEQKRRVDEEKMSQQATEQICLRQDAKPAPPLASLGDEEKLKAWCHWVSKNPIDEDQAEMGKAITALFTSRAELLAEVKRGDEAIAALQRKLNMESYVSDKRAQERDAAEVEVKRLRAALEKIAGLDYRGNRSAEMQIAWEALGDGEGKE